MQGSTAEVEVLHGRSEARRSDRVVVDRGLVVKIVGKAVPRKGTEPLLVGGGEFFGAAKRVAPSKALARVRGGVGPYSLVKRHRVDTLVPSGCI